MVTRQGVGAFVAAAPRRPFRIEGGELRSLREVIEVMELRTGIEIEAAGLAAERASPAQLARISEAYEAVDRAIGRGDAGVDQDFAFHRSIAEATENPQFVNFLEYLGRFIIPRQTIRIAVDRPAERRAYLAKIQEELDHEKNSRNEALKAIAEQPCGAPAQQPQALPSLAGSKMTGRGCP